MKFILAALVSFRVRPSECESTLPWVWKRRSNRPVSPIALAMMSWQSTVTKLTFRRPPAQPVPSPVNHETNNGRVPGSHSRCLSLGRLGFQARGMKLHHLTVARSTSPILYFSTASLVCAFQLCARHGALVCEKLTAVIFSCQPIPSRPLKVDDSPLRNVPILHQQHPHSRTAVSSSLDITFSYRPLYLFR